MGELLFSEGKIGKVTLKNRLVMTAMGINLAYYDGTPSKEMISYYEARAKGGAGLIIPEITRVNEVHGRGLMRQLSVSEDRHIAPLAELAEAVHKHGSKIFIQLHHPGRESVAALGGWKPLVGPSAIMCKYSMEQTRALGNEEVKQLVQEFINGAVRVQKAGCDGVELHAAHGYLINQFLSPYSNKRTDEYGGSFDNRMRFLAEMIEGIHLACGDFPISVRLSVDEFLDQTGVREDYIHLEDGIKITVALEKLGIDVINVSCGTYETAYTCIEPISFAQGWRRDFIKAIKDSVQIPVIAVSVIRDPQVAESFLADGILDFVGMGRSWLADEQWGVKAQEGREKEIRKCISCLRCFASLPANMMKNSPPECSVNPYLAHEYEYGELVKDTANRKAVVVGGGPSGLVAAKTLAERGIQVVLLEKQAMLGGQINLSTQVPLKERMQWLIDYYQNEMQRLDVDVRLNTEVTPEMVMGFAPDGVIIATGSTSIAPVDIPGINNENVYLVEDVLTGQSGLSDKKVVVLGAGMTGIETAEYLCAANNQVTVLDMAKKVAGNAYGTNVADVMGRLNNYGVKVRLGLKIKALSANGVIVEDLKSGEELIIPADAMVLSLGQKSNHALAEALAGKCGHLVVVGDAHKPGIIAQATKEGFEAGRKLFL